MSRVAQLPDGTQLQFPDNTADDVMDRVVKEHLTQSTELATAAQQDAASGAKGTTDGVTGEVTGESAPPRPALPPAATPPSAMSQLGQATANTVAGALQGAVSPLDAITKGIASAGQLAFGEGGKLQASLSDLLGQHDFAQLERQNAAAMNHQLANPTTLGGLIEQASPTPEGMGGWRLASQMLGGAFLPMPKLADIPIIPAEPAEANAAQDLIAAGAQHDIPVTTSDALPPTTFIGRSARAFGEKVPWFGTGGLRAEQAAKRVDAVHNLMLEHGAPGAEIDPVMADFSAQRGAQLEQLTGVKTAIANKLGSAGNVPVDRTVTAIDDQISQLQGLGVPELNPVIAKLQGWKQALAAGKTLPQIEAIRKVMGNAFKGQDMATIRGDGEKALSAIYGPMRDDLTTFVRQRGGADDLQKWTSANKRLSLLAGELGNNTLKRVLATGEMTPENVASLLFSKKPSDVARLYNGLSDAGKARARAAILSKALEGAGGLDELSADKFLGQVKQLSAPMRIFFRDGELDGLVRVLKGTRQAAAAGVLTKTGQEAAPYAIGALMTKLFGPLGGVTMTAAGGLLARAYESVTVRNLLVGLSRTKAASAQEARLMPRVVSAFTSAVNDNVPNAMRQSPAPRAAAEDQNQ